MAKKLKNPERRKKRFKTYKELAIGLVKIWLMGTCYIVNEAEAQAFAEQKIKEFTA